MAGISSIHIKSNHKKTSAIEFYKNSKSAITTDLTNPGNLKARKDSRGIPILKGKKNHKLVFADQIQGSNLVNIVEIECYKEFNVVDEDSTPDKLNENNKNSENVSCTCIFL